MISVAREEDEDTACGHLNEFLAGADGGAAHGVADASGLIATLRPRAILPAGARLGPPADFSTRAWKASGGILDFGTLVLTLER